MDNLKLFFNEQAVIDILYIIEIIIFGLVIIKLLIKCMKRFLLQSPLDNSLISFILSGLSIALYLGLLCIILSIFGLNPTIIFSVLSACGVAIALALKDSLSNVANGLIIVSTKPFQTGDYVEIGSFSGTVKEIGIIRTELITPDNKRVVLANNLVMENGVINYSSNQLRRVDLVISVAYDTNIEFAKQIIIKACLKCKKILREQGVFCEFSEMNDSSLDFKTRVWCLTPDYWDTYYDCLKKIYNDLLENNINIPYNVLDVIVSKGDKNA